jgi:hypothetical protein
MSALPSVLVVGAVHDASRTPANVGVVVKRAVASASANPNLNRIRAEGSLHSECHAIYAWRVMRLSVVICARRIERRRTIRNR